MKTSLAMMAAGMVLAVVAGCTTLGVGGERPMNEQAFEGASLAMATAYFMDIREREPKPTIAETADAMLAAADDYLIRFHPNTGWTYLSLAEDLIGELSDGKFKPQVRVIYSILLTFLDSGDQAKRTGGPRSITMALTELQLTPNEQREVDLASAGPSVPMTMWINGVE